ncbi:aminotransferase class IV [Anabaena aphanizomenioides LEGE 00250]|uniref:Aminotransferase class IV n=1 Tax=Sphaerospermopsis aphanizomenoides LEGE 00250 TaxID=2777972 RepID=A0ABR9VGA9_9CYAN|nr:aminotransferase class IV [Sphaerospermopsis aphanizomenoides LEGE 00250]
MTIWRDGAWLDGCAANDRGATLGDGLFETILWRNGRAVRLDRHIARMRASAEALGLPAAEALNHVDAIIADLAARNALSDQRAAVNLRLAVLGPRGLDRHTPHVTLSARIAPAPASDTSIALATVSIRRNETAPSARHKTLSYLDQIEARRQARTLGADEAAQLNTHGNLAGAAAGNVILIVKDRALTPRVRDGALPGTVRAELLVRGLIEEVVLEAADIAAADAATVTNAIFGVRPVHSWDGRALAADHPRLAPLRTVIES